MKRCEMTDDCANAVTHIGEKGYIYCTPHAESRRASGYESTRKMRAWELRWINEGKALPSYRSEPEPSNTEVTEPADRCPACGDVIDYCQGHGEIGDPDGAHVLESHDGGQHSLCHPLSECRS